MPQGYRMLFWLLIVDILLLTLWVWILAYSAVVKTRAGMWFPVEDFRLLMLGYHGLLFMLSLIGWGMQTIWQKINTLALFPVSLVLGVLSLHVAAFQMFVLMQAYLI